MQLAHQRMGEIGSQNIDLVQEVASLKEMINCQKTPDGQHIGEDELPEVTARCSELDGHSASLLTNDAGIEVQKGNGSGEEGRHRLKSKEELTCVTQNNPDEPPSSDDSMIRQIAELSTELQLAQASVTSLNEEKRRLEVELSSLLSTEGELVQRLQTDLQAKDHELDSLRNRIETLQNELVDSKASLGVSLGQRENRDDAIVVSSQTREGELDQMRELQELRAANFAAQEWMEKAVEHNQMLTEKVAVLEIDAEQLKKQLKFGDASGYIGEGDGPEVVASKSAGGGNREGTVCMSSDSCTEVERRKLHPEGRALSRGDGVLSNEFENELQALRIVRVDLDKTCKSQTLKIDDLQRRILELTEERNISALEITEMTAKLKEFETAAEMSQEKELALQVEVLVSEKTLLNEQLKKLELSLDDVTKLEFELDEQKGLVDLANARLSQAKAELQDTEGTLKQWQGTCVRISQLKLSNKTDDLTFRHRESGAFGFNQ